jgi:hypothetical protein
VYPTNVYDTEKYFAKANVVLIDTMREQQIGIGTEWPFDPIPAGMCIVPEGLAASRGWKIG